MSQLQNYQRPLYQRRFIQDCFFAVSLENDRGLTKNDTPLNMVCEHDAFIHSRLKCHILLASNVER